jgi:drug/metabolite transporter (DMT)-like permease
VRERPLLIGSVAVVAAASGFGLLGPLARFAYDAGLEPLSLVAWRAGFGTAIVGLYAGWRIARGRHFAAPWRLTRRDLAGLAVVTTTSLVLNISMFFAFGLATVALVLLAFYTYPALVAVVAVARGHERLDAVRGLALALSLGGMVLVVAGGLDPAGGVRVDLLGIGLAFLAALAQTTFVTVSRFGFATIPTEQAIGWVLLITTLICAVLAIVTGGGTALALPLRSTDALALTVVSGVAAAGIPSVLFLAGIRSIGGMRTGILMLFEPVVGVALAAALLDEAILPIQAIGGLAILGAAVLIQRGAPSARPAARNSPQFVGGLDR